MFKKTNRWIGLLVAVVMLLSASIGIFLAVQHRADLYYAQEEMLAQLENDVGQYDDQSIVLQNTSKAKAEELANLYGADLRITKDGRYATLTLPEDTTIRDVCALKESLPHIKELSADYQVHVSELTEGEESYGRLPMRPQYLLQDADYDKQTYLDYLNLKDAWTSYTGMGVTVAVIDTGIDTDHPEFAGRISAYSYNATEDKVVKDYKDEQGNYDWSLIEDEQGHGTAVTGVIAASMNSGNVVGVAPGVNIIVIKAECHDNGVFERTSDLVFGLYYAIERDVQVVNMSFATGINHFAKPAQLAYDSDVICVAAAGNYATAIPMFPAADPNVIGVGALAADSWELADYSNYGENVDMVAPGSTYTTLQNGEYGTMKGTSLASPIVAGAIALYMQKDPYATFDKVTKVAYASGVDLGDLGRDRYYGFGALDAYALLKEKRGTITYDMLTDELENEEGLFISGHTLQEMPEPERLYAVFDGWYYDDTFTQECAYYEDKFYDNVTLYAKWINEADGVPYTYVTLEDGTIEIRSYTGRRRYITIPEKIDGRVVSSIGEEAFSGQTRLREVALPSGLEQIRYAAFYNCSNLMNITIPANVTVIEDEAFRNNVRLYTVAFADNSRLESIGDLAFAACSSLESIELPARVKTVTGSAFYGATTLRSITVQKGNQHFNSHDGVLYNITGDTLVAFPANHSETYTVPDSTVEIGNYAFGYAQLKSVDLTRVCCIGRFAFAHSQLEMIEIPDSVENLGDNVFCFNERLAHVDLGSGLAVVPAYAFDYCTALHSICIPNNIVTIKKCAFSFSGLQELYFEENSSLTEIGWRAFHDCQIRSVVIPDSVQSIGDSAFSALFYSPLQEVVITEHSDLRYIGASAFDKCFDLTDVYLPRKLTFIGSLAFAHTGLSSVTIPAATQLGDGVFAYNINLTEIVIEENNPYYHSIDNVVYSKDATQLIQYPGGKEGYNYFVEPEATIVMPYAFSGTVHLGYVVMSDGMTILAECSFFDSSIEQIDLPSTLIEIQQKAFYNCTNLQRLNIPAGVTQIGRYFVAKCQRLSSVSFERDAKLPRISYGAFAYSGITSFTVPANVSTIAQGAFEGCSDLTSITFEEGSKLESISAYMFDGCSNLRRITFGSGTALTSIQAHGLEGMTQLTFIDFGDAQLTNIDNFAFRFCASLSELELPDTLTNIGRYAFYGCSSLEELTIPAQVERIGSYAFMATKDIDVYFVDDTLPVQLDDNWDFGIKGYYIGVESVHTNGDYRYAVLISGNVAILEYLGNDSSVDLTKVNLGAPITIIGGSAFENSDVTSIVLPDTLTIIQMEAFRYASLKQIVIPASVTFIGREAFAYTDLNTVTFADGSQLSVVEQYAFEKTKNLRSVMLPVSVQTLGTGVFFESGLESIAFEEGIRLTTIPQQAFASTKLKAVALPDSVTLVDHDAFNNVTTLKSVSFGDNEDIRLMSNAFYHTGLTSLHIPANVTYIGEYCFVALADLTEYTVAEDNPNYTAVDGLLLTKTGRKLVAVPAGRTGSLTVPSSVEEIGFGAFEESSLTEVLFHEDANVLSLGYRAFFKAKNLASIHIPASVVSIDYYAFGYCGNLQSVTFAEDNQLKGIYEGAFIGCIRLDDIVLPDSIVEISDFAFYGCSALTDVPVNNADRLRGIYSYAFAYSGIGGEFTTPENLYDIGDYAFIGTAVTKVTVPDTMQEQLIIGIGAFEDCTQLEEITLPFIGASFEDDRISWFGYIFGAGAYDANDEYVPKSLKTVTITEGITAIYSGGFAYCTELETINLPDTMSALWNDAMLDVVARYELANPVMTYWLNLNDSVYTVAKQEHFGYGIAGDLVLAEGITDIEKSAFACCGYLNRVTIPEGITTIKDHTFYECFALTEVILPNGITTIGYNVFGGCHSLEKVNLPDTVKSIDAYAFLDCYSLTEVSIPEGVTTLEHGVFSGCTGLESVTLPNSLTELGGAMFSGCTSLTEMVIPSQVTVIRERTFYGCESMKTVSFSDDVTEIEEDAFSQCSSLESVTIPDSVVCMGQSCFKECSALKELIIGNGLTTIPEYAFSGCSALRRVTIPSNVLEIGHYAFYRCVRLYEVYNLSDLDLSIGATDHGWVAYYADVINDKNNNRIFKEGLTDLIDTEDGFRFVLQKGTYKLIAYTGSEEIITLPTDINGNPYTLAMKNGGHTVVVPAGLEINASAFSENIDIRSVIIEPGVTEIGINAFSSCSNLTNISIPNSVTSIGDSAFVRCADLQEILLPDSLTDIGSHAFWYCTSLTSVTIPEGVTRIRESCFSECRSLHTVNLPNTITQIQSGAFSGCTKLVNITLPPKAEYIYSNAFANCSSLTSIVIPKGARRVDSNAFANCTGLTTVTLPDRLSVVNSTAFSGCASLTTLLMSDNSGNYLWENGILYTLDNNGQISVVLVSDTISDYVVLPDGLTKIPSGMFKNRSKLKSVVIPGSVTSIGSDAFSGCSQLSSVTIPDTVTNIGQNAFMNCTELVEITLPKGMKSIAYRAFYGCVKLQRVTIPDTVTTIGGGAFSGCSSLAEISLPDGVTKIEGPAFEQCSSLTKVTLPNNLKTIGAWTFSECTSLESIELPDSLTSIEYATFSQCSALKAIDIPNGVVSVADYAFDSCTALTTVTMGNGVTTIGSYAFEYCSNLTEVILGDSVTTIGSGAFYYCQKLAPISLPESLTRIESNAFISCNAWDTLVIPAQTAYIDSTALPRNLYFTVAGENTHYCSIDGVLYDRAMTMLIRGHDRMESIVIPEGITHIDDYAFTDCKSLFSITIPESVTTIGSYAFSGCYYLYEVHNNSDIPITFGSEDNGYLGSYAYVITDKDGNKTYKDGVTEFCYIDTEDGFKFVKENNQYTLMAYLGDEETITLPEKIQGHKYTLRLRYGGTNVIIPAAFTKIDKYAFEQNTDIRSVVIENGVTEIDFSAFSQCTNLISVDIPDTVTTIHNSAFFQCSKLSDVRIGKGVKRIGEWSFFQCSSLTDIQLPDSLESIAGGTYNAFADTAIYERSRDENGLVVIDGWLISIENKSLRYMPDIPLRGIARSAYEDCSLLKLACWNDTAPVNVETLIVRDISQTLQYPPLTLKNVIISSDVTTAELANHLNFLQYVSGVTIYVEGNADDLRWDENFPGWNLGNRVVYGERWSWVTFLNEDGSILRKEPRTANQIIRLPVCSKAKDEQCVYVFSGWDIDDDGRADSIPAQTIVDVTAKALFTAMPRMYTVTFRDSASAVVYWEGELGYGAEISAPDAPVQEGKVFVGWARYTEGITVNGDMTFYATWHSHRYEVVEKQPTCTEDGSSVYTCECGDTYTVERVPALGHAYGDWYETIAPTCLAVGEQRRECAICGCSETIELAMLEHVWTQFQAKAPTCTAFGWDDYETCFGCGQTTYVEISALGHDLTQHTAKVPTCTEIGWNTYETCSRCEHTTYVEIPATGHAHNAVVTAPTCTEQGYTTYTCHCGDTYVGSYVNAIGHDYGDWFDVREATCVKGGEKRRNCADCDHFELENVAATGHRLTQYDAKAPTCVKVGWNTYEVCYRCDYTTYVEIPATGHAHNAVVTAPTCTERGYTTYTCHCGDTYVDSYVNAIGHDYGDWFDVREATCVKGGEKRRNCADCDHFELENVAATGHRLTQHTAKVPTCTEIGWDTYETCSRCDYTTYVEIPANGHDHNAVVTAPTCTEQGYTTYTCHCGDTYVDSYVNAIGHDYEKVIKKATLTTNGVIKNVCKTCGYTASKTTTIYKASSVKLSKTSYTYNGKVQKPSVVIKDSKGKTISSSNYTVTYPSGMKNAGTYKVTVKFKGNYSGTKTLTYTIKGIDVSKCKISLSTTSYTYNGKAKKPSVTVKNANGTKLTTSSYTVTYASGRKNVGTYKVTVKMKGNYTGTKTLTFKINPVKTSISSLTAGSKKLTVKWAKKSTQVTGYQIQYSTSKSFKSYKTKTVSSYKTTKATLSSLKAKTTYYVRVRTYKTVNGTKYYSGWSTAKSVKTK